MKIAYGIFIGIAVLTLVLSAGCIAEDNPPFVPGGDIEIPGGDTEIEEYGTLVVSCNVNGALVQLFNGKVLVAKAVVSDEMAFFDLPVGTPVRTAIVTADGYETIDPVPVGPIEAGKVSVVMVELIKKT